MSLFRQYVSVLLMLFAVVALLFGSNQNRGIRADLFLSAARFLMLAASLPALCSIRKPHHREWIVTAAVACIIVLLDVIIFHSPPRAKIDNVPYRPFGLVDVLILGPLAEELFFRGQLWRVFAGGSHRRPLIPLIATSLLFGLYHLSYWSFQLSAEAMTHIATTTAAGLIFGILRWRTESLLWPCLAHLAINTALLAVRVL